jgi:hypothetical protein
MIIQGASHDYDNAFFTRDALQVSRGVRRVQVAGRCGTAAWLRGYRNFMTPMLGMHT